MRLYGGYDCLQGMQNAGIPPPLKRCAHEQEIGFTPKALFSGATVKMTISPGVDALLFACWRRNSQLLQATG